MLVMLVSMIGTELLILSYRNRWYEKQDKVMRPACERIQVGMSPNDVWQLAGQLGEPHGEWQADHSLGFWASHGSCTVSLDPKTNQVVTREYSQPKDRFVGFQ